MQAQPRQLKESEVFARRVYMHLKPKSVEEFTKKMENEVIPILRKHKGFQDEITFVAPGGADVFGISLWETAENAEQYNRESYPSVMKVLSQVTEGTPQVKTYEVCNSTFHKVAMPVTA
jgi:hypothetical protein